MNVLAIDSSTDILAVSLKTGQGWAEACLDLGLKHAERLMDLVDFCLSRAGLAAGDLDLLACAEGPGSFTGLRIGFSTVKGMALALGKPWIAVPTLDCLAWGQDSFPGAVVPLIDGKKGRLYAAIYARGKRESEWLDIPAGQLLSLLDSRERVLFTGPDASVMEESCQGRTGFFLDERRGWPASRALAVLAERALSERGPAHEEDGPLYLRPSEAEETARDRETALTEAKAGGRP